MKKLRITIGNKSYDVTVEDLTEPEQYHGSSAPGRTNPPSAAPRQPVASGTPTPRPLPLDDGTVTSPMAGTIKSILVKAGDRVKQDQPLVILEAMKMENQVTSPGAGSVKSINVKVGDSVQEGQVLLTLE